MSKTQLALRDKILEHGIPIRYATNGLMECFIDWKQSKSNKSKSVMALDVEDEVGWQNR